MGLREGRGAGRWIEGGGEVEGRGRGELKREACGNYVDV